MRCACVSSSTVIDSRPHQLGIRRRRKCDNCGERWTTIESEIIEAVEYRGVSNGHPLAKKFFALLKESKLAILTAEKLSGVSRNTMYKWRNTNVPQVNNLNSCLNVIGYELAIKKLGERECIPLE